MEQPNQTQLKQIKVVPNRLSKPNQNKLHQTKPSRARFVQLLYRPVLLSLLLDSYTCLLIVVSLLLTLLSISSTKPKLNTWKGLFLETSTVQEILGEKDDSEETLDPDILFR